MISIIMRSHLRVPCISYPESEYIAPVYTRACVSLFLNIVFFILRRISEGKRGEIERPMRNVRRVHAPAGFGVYVHCHGRFSEVEHYKCTPGEPSRSTKIDLSDRVSREGQVHRAKRNRGRSLVRSFARVRAHVYQIWAVIRAWWNRRAMEFYKH